MSKVLFEFSDVVGFANYILEQKRGQGNAVTPDEILNWQANLR